MQLILEAEEAQILREIVSQSLIDLRGEIGDTHDYDLRQELHRREATLQRILGQIERLASGVG